MTDYGTPSYPQQPPTGGPGGPGGPTAPGGPPARKGFFGALFDFGFEHFITPMIVKFVYVLSVIVLGLTWLIFLIAGFSQNAASGIAVLVLGPIAVILYLAFIRMTLEFYLAIVRMSEDIHQRLR